MPRYFTHYWKNKTWDERPGATLGHTAGNQFRRRGVAPGDVVYIITVKHGRLHVGSRLTVKAIVGQKAAERALGLSALWEADDHVIAQRPEPFWHDKEVPARLVAQLRFVPGRAPALKRGQLLDQQTLRGIRELTPGSAAMLDGLLGRSAGGRTAAATGQDRGWRADPVAAGQMLQRLLKDTSAQTRAGALRMLGEAILTAEQRHPGRWIVTLHQPYVRLIVGMVMCLQLRADGRATVVLRRLLAPRGYRAGGEYARAPGCVEVEVSTDSLVRDYAKLRAAHEAAMAICAATHPGTGAHRQAHSPGVVQYLDSLLQLPKVDLESAVEAELMASIHIGPTERQELRNARIGQGRYRRNLEQIEKRCRVTGIENPDHLRASHIKPWAKSTNVERLDGYNGLLLAPHVDHLFDDGWISFEDDGRMLVATTLDATVLARWGIDPSRNCGVFHPRQKVYLAYHRKQVFKLGRGSTEVAR